MFNPGGVFACVDGQALEYEEKRHQDRRDELIQRYEYECKELRNKLKQLNHRIFQIESEKQNERLIFLMMLAICNIT